MPKQYFLQSALGSSIFGKSPKRPQNESPGCCKVLKKSKHFVQMWNQRYKTDGNVDDSPKSGAPRATSKREENKIIHVFENNPTISLRRSREILREKKVDVSIETIRKRLAERNAKFQSTIAKPLLTEKQVNKRLTWCKENLNRCWDNVVFTDESSFWIFNRVTHA